MLDNTDRAENAFAQIAGYGEQWQYDLTSTLDQLNEDDHSMLAQQMGDLLCDMHHLADLAKLDWEGLLERGDYHYQAEIAEEAADA